MRANLELVGELSTAGGRGGLDTPAAAPGGGQVVTPTGAGVRPVGSHPAPSGAPAPDAGLVRLETSEKCERPEREDRAIRDGLRRSLRLFKSVSCAGDLLRGECDEKGRRLFGVFLTLTYRPEVYWRRGHVSGFLDHVRKWTRRRDVALRFVWVAEQHKTGRIHYHMIFFLPKGVILPKPDKQGWWPYGATRIERCRKQSVGYLIKYATKCQSIDHPWPKGMRLHGHGGLDLAQRIRRAWWVLPKYIRIQCEDWMRVRRARGGGWVSQVTGEWWPADPIVLTT